MSVSGLDPGLCSDSDVDVDDDGFVATTPVEFV